MLAVLGRKREPFFEGTRGDQGIERLQSMRARVGFHEVVRAAGNVRVGRDRAAPTQYKIEIVGFALRVGAGKEFEAGDRGDAPRTGEAIQEARRCYAAARDVYNDVRVNQVRHQMTRGSVAWLAHAVFVRYAVGDVVAVGPHAEDRPVSHGPRPLWGGFRGHVHLDSRTFGELHIFQRLEDAV